MILEIIFAFLFWSLFTVLLTILSIFTFGFGFALLNIPYNIISYIDFKNMGKKEVAKFYQLNFNQQSLFLQKMKKGSIPSRLNRDLGRTSYLNRQTSVRESEHDDIWLPEY